MRTVWLSLVLLSMLFGGVITLHDQHETRASRRLRAEAQWREQGLQHYRIGIRVQTGSVRCVQELEIAGGKVVSTPRDTCNRSWLGQLTVERLFELSRRFEQPGECYPSNGVCTCKRVRVGSVQYDAERGYPLTFDWRREVFANWVDTSYWLSAFKRRNLPSCLITSPTLRIAVVSLTPLP